MRKTVLLLGMALIASSAMMGQVVNRNMAAAITSENAELVLDSVVTKTREGKPSAKVVYGYDSEKRKAYEVSISYSEWSTPAYAPAYGDSIEYTYDQVFTRMEGRTPVPEREKLASLAAHGATMVIFLSIGLVDKVQDALLQGGAYTPDTPAAVVYKATWPEQKTVRCTVGSLAQSVHDAGITKTALIVAGDFLGTRYERSKLYDPGFTTEFRKGSDQ